MAQETKAPRTCVIRRDGGDVVVRLQADNMLQAGGEFLLSAPDGKERARWKMATGAAGSAEHTVTSATISVPSLEGNHMRWKVLVCAMHADQGTVELGVSQGGGACSVTPPARWQLSSVPPCEPPGKATPIDAALTFRCE